MIRFIIFHLRELIIKIYKKKSLKINLGLLLWKFKKVRKNKPFFKLIYMLF